MHNKQLIVKLPCAYALRDLDKTRDARFQIHDVLHTATGLYCPLYNYLNTIGYGIKLQSNHLFSL